VAHRGIADHAGEFGQSRDRLADDGRSRHRIVGGGGADDQRTALHLDAVEPLDVRQVDQMRWAGQPLLHHRQQRMAAGDDLGVFILDQEIGGLPNGCRTMIFEFVHEMFLIAVRDVRYARSEFAIALAPAAID
jgi:hypothetical protein